MYAVVFLELELQMQGLSRDFIWNWCTFPGYLCLAGGGGGSEWTCLDLYRHVKTCQCELKAGSLVAYLESVHHSLVLVLCWWGGSLELLPLKFDTALMRGH